MEKQNAFSCIYSYRKLAGKCAFNIHYHGVGFVTDVIQFCP